MSRRDSPGSVLTSPYASQAFSGTSDQSEEEYLTVTKNVLKSPFRTFSPTAPSPRTLKAPIDDEDEQQQEEEISEYGSFLNVPWSPPQGAPKSPSKSPSKTTRRVPLSQPLPTETPSPEDVEHILSLRAKLKEEEIEKRVEDKMLQLTKRMEAIKIAAKQELQQLQQNTIKTQQQINMQLIQEHDKHNNAINKVISDITKKQEDEQRKTNEQVQRAKELINLQKQKEQQEELEKRKQEQARVEAEAAQKQKEADEKKRQEDLQKKLKDEANQKEENEKKKQQLQQHQTQPKPAQAVLDNNQPAAQPSASAVPVASAPSNIPAHLKLAVSSNDPDCISTAALNQLIPRMTTYYQIQDKVKTLEQDPSWPNAKKDYFKKINMAVNTISNSSSQILKKFEELASLLAQTRQQNPLVYYYCIDLIASKIMDQGSTQVSLHRDSCYSYAALVVALSSKFPDFGELVLGHFHRACPYTLPYYPVKQPGQGDAEYMDALGFKRKISLSGAATGPPQFESEDAYSERMRGILSIYAAITQTHFPNIPNFHGISFGWTWFARILNLKPRKITADVILTFLEVAGHKLLASYNRQYHKILGVLKDEMLTVLPKEATAANTRLQLFLNEYAKTMKITTPKASSFSD